MVRIVTALMVSLVGLPVLADPVSGYWLTENKKAIIRINPCDDSVCGTMVWMANPHDEAGARKLDVNNDDPVLKGRTICGLPMVGGMSLRRSGVWADGWIYNPRDGATYSAELSSVSDDALKVRGYLGLPLLGRSQIWTRVEGNRGGC